jgi:hypothetical protein
VPVTLTRTMASSERGNYVKSDRRVRSFLAALVVGFAVTVAVTGCGTHTDDTDAIEAQFGLIEQTRLEGYWNDDDCRFIAYAGKSYSNKAFECSVGDLPTPGRLDDGANATIDMIDAAFKSAGVTISYVAVRPDTDGRIGRGSWFVLDSKCDAYTFDPGWTKLPEPPTIEPGAATAINTDWYLIDGCA